MTRYTTGPVGRLQDGRHMTTGPVGRFPLDPGPHKGTGPIGRPGTPPPPSGSIHAAPGDKFTWATVTNPDPLTIQLDGPGMQDLPLVPETLIPPSALLPYTRVWVQLHATAQAQRVIILGLAAGRNSWVDATVLPGFGVRDGNAAYQPQVFLDASGLVHFQGQMGPTGFPSSGNVNPGGSDVPILQLPDGYQPQAEQRWIGFPTNDPSATIGGWIGAGDGQLYVKATSPSPTSHWCIIVSPWVPTPAQPY